MCGWVGGWIWGNKEEESVHTFRCRASFVFCYFASANICGLPQYSLFRATRDLGSIGGGYDYDTCGSVVV